MRELKQVRPNPRLQRTRSAPLRSPLSRKLLGRVSARSVERAVFLMAMAWLITGTALPKCVLQRIPILLAAKDSCSGTSLEGVSLEIFANDDAAGVRISPQPSRTNAVGRFDGEFEFSTYSGFERLHGDVCDRRLSRITVVATRQGYVTTRLEISGKSLRAVTDSARGAARVLELKMTPAP
jgi:hypothetical protein